MFTKRRKVPKNATKCTNKKCKMGYHFQGNTCQTETVSPQVTLNSEKHLTPTRQTKTPSIEDAMDVLLQKVEQPKLPQKNTFMAEEVQKALAVEKW